VHKPSIGLIRLRCFRYRRLGAYPFRFVNRFTPVCSEQDVQEHLSVGVSVHSLQYWVRSSRIVEKSLPHHSILSCAVVLASHSSKPLQIWSKKVKNGHIKRITDQDIQSSVLEVMGTNVSTNYIACPADPQKTLGIKLPFLVMIIKNLKKYFTFEVQVLDDKGVRRRFRASNYQSTTRVKPFICTMPMRLDEGWNQIQFNLADFTRRAYGTNYIETLRVQIHANCRIRRYVSK